MFIIFLLSSCPYSWAFFTYPLLAILKMWCAFRKAKSVRTQGAVLQLGHLREVIISPQHMSVGCSTSCMCARAVNVLLLAVILWIPFCWVAGSNLATQNKIIMVVGMTRISDAVGGPNDLHFQKKKKKKIISLVLIKTILNSS